MKCNEYAGEIRLIYVLVPPWLLLVREGEGSLYTSTQTRRLPKCARGRFRNFLVLLPPTSLPCLYVRTDVRCVCMECSGHLFTPLWLFPPCLPWLLSSANQGCRRDLPQESSHRLITSGIFCRAMAGRGSFPRRYIRIVMFVACQTEVQSMDCRTSARQLPVVHDSGCMMFIPR
ncbi:hypothetical protein EV401DRAFT_1971693 [Pisolithus croceorrhizus]|nr:hypothetical protein EV401DRAFT_1971693 [Pisolithus croceorrhizus]